MIIEKLNIKHYDLFIDLWNKAELPTRLTGRDSLKKLTYQFGVDHFAMFGLFQKDKVIAVALVTDDSRKGWINRIAVMPEHRGKGYARLLIKHCEEYFKEKGIEVFAVLIEDYNKSSLALFQKEGYTLHRDIHYVSKRLRPDS